MRPPPYHPTTDTHTHTHFSLSVSLFTQLELAVTKKSLAAVELREHKPSHVIPQNNVSSSVNNYAIKLLMGLGVDRRSNQPVSGFEQRHSRGRTGDDWRALRGNPQYRLMEAFEGSAFQQNHRKNSTKIVVQINFGRKFPQENKIKMHEIPTGQADDIQDKSKTGCQIKVCIADILYSMHVQSYCLVQ